MIHEIRKDSDTMNDQTKKEIIKSIVYGMSADEIAEIYGLSADKVNTMIQENAEKIKAEREYRAMLEG